MEASEHPLYRREFLAAALSLAVPFCSLRAEEPRKKALWMDEPKGPYAPFRMALQTYSLRKFDYNKMMESAYDLQLGQPGQFGFLDLWPDHLPKDLDEGEFRRRRRALRANSLKEIAYGVVEFTKDHDSNREIFEFSRRINVYAITARPAPDSFDSLDKLVEELGVAVAIHNHGPEDKMYGTPDLIDKAIKDHHKRIGVCIDVGHFLRCGVKPLEVVKTFKDRVYAVHLKDVKSEGGKYKDVVLGQGDLDLVAFLKGLKEAGFKGGLAIEYEEEPENPIPSIKKCLEAVKEAVKKI